MRLGREEKNIMSKKKELPIQRYHANARERDRTHRYMKNYKLFNIILLFSLIINIY